MSVGVATDARGSTRAPTMHQASIDIGLLTLTRLQDKDSQRAMELIGTEHKNGNIRLVRPSRDGALPGTNLDLTDVTVVSYASVGGDRPRDRLELAVGWMKVAGMGKDEAPNLKKGKSLMPPTSWQLKVGGGGADAWPPIPLVSAKFSLAGAGLSTGERSRPAGGKPNPGPFRATVEMGAGMGLTRLAQVPARGEHLEIAIAESGTDRFEMHEALVEKISNAGEPDVVQVDFIAQTGGFMKATGGAKAGGQAGASTR